MRLNYDEGMTMSRISGLLGGIGYIGLGMPTTKEGALENEYSQAKVPASDLLNSPKFNFCYTVVDEGPPVMYVRSRKFSSEWRKTLKRGYKDNPWANAALKKAVAGEPLTEDEALFTFMYYERRKRAAEIRARKKRAGAYGALIAVGATVGAYLLAPVVLGTGTAASGGGAATTTGTAAAATGTTAAASAATTAATAAPVAVTTGAGATIASKAADGATSVAKEALKKGATQAQAEQAASSSYWDLLLKGGSKIAESAKVQELIPGLSTQQAQAIQPSPMVTPSPSIPYTKIAIGAGVGLLAIITGAYILKKK